ncbi:hypothetical protein MCEREM21A_01361 [Sphingomonadaceae bacterium]
MMDTKNKPIPDQLEVECQTPNKAIAFEEVVARAGGVVAISRAVCITPNEFNRWQKQGSVPLGKAMVMEHLYGVSFRNLLSDNDALWLSLMQLERSLGDTKAELTKALKLTSAVLDTIAKLPKKYSDNNGDLCEVGV